MFFSLQLSINTPFFTVRFIFKYFKGIGEEFLKKAISPSTHNFNISFVFIEYHRFMSEQPHFDLE
ncbi:hypothetical protein B2D07_05380 [Desulfococcus multivorans]|nr:uncharacterized protein Dmul_11060 [Desulfococcus multivorans]AQV00260.1 hypothetical protein B2D07_05380 [Desulfococcus multivorans]